MWTATPPTATLSDHLDACETGMEENLAARLRTQRDLLETLSLEFRKAAHLGTCWNLSKSKFHVPNIPDSELIKLYRYHFVRRNGRKYYDQILSNALLKRCPLCEDGQVSTLDHFLPKKHYPALSVDPWNLVPACRDCNTELRAMSATSPEDEHIHPYFWQDTEEWLFGVVHQSDSPFIEFSVRTPNSWDTLKTKRVENHFKRLGLKERFAVASATGIVQTTASLGSLLITGDPERVRSHLEEVTAHLLSTFGANYWRTAMLKTLASESWYWDWWIWQDSTPRVVPRLSHSATLQA